MKQQHTVLTIPTRGKGLYEFTDAVENWLTTSGVREGLVTLFIQHTSASLTVQENADPDVVADLKDFFARIAPENDPAYRHTLEGSDDMPAHIRAALTLTQLSVPVVGGRMRLGTWQGLYVFEHRSARHARQVVAHFMGE
jgi:secondary thiamine-phosphate synthase enzyme